MEDKPGVFFYLGVDHCGEDRGGRWWETSIYFDDYAWCEHEP